MNRVSDDDRSTLFPFLARGASQEHAPQSGEIIGILKAVYGRPKRRMKTARPTIRNSLQRRRKLPLEQQRSRQNWPDRVTSQSRWRASRMTWATRRGPWPLTRSWPPSSPKVVAASHRSGRSARRAGLEKARFVSLAHLALRSTWKCGWLLASSMFSCRLSCQSHGALYTS